MHTLSGKYRKKNRVKPTRDHLWIIYGKTCWWCHEIITLEDSSVEHLIPISRGGADDMWNTVLACKPCNNNRGNDFTPTIAARVFTALGWKHQPLWEVCPDIFSMSATIPHDIAVAVA